jgi:photosystem II stability/assembly factor-like uncharacterized protein
MKKLILLLIILPIFSFAQNQATVANASVINSNGAYTKYTGQTYIGGLQNDSGTDILIKGNYPYGGFAMYRYQNKWIISQFSSSIVFGFDILDFSNTVLYEHQSTEDKPPCSDSWLNKSNSTNESLNIVGFCYSDDDGIFINNEEFKFLCASGTTQVPLVLSGSLTNTDNYKIQLSDENGNFQNAVNIGDANSNLVTVSYPNPLVSLGNYKVRAFTILVNLDSVKSNEVPLSLTLPDLYTLYTGGVHCVGSNAEIIIPANYTFQVDSLHYYFGDSLITVSNSSTLTINNINPTNQGNYRARIEKNGCIGPYSNNYFANVRNSPSLEWPNIKDFEKAYCTPGNSHTINTTAWYFGRIMRGSSLEWLRDGVIVPNENQNQLYISNVNESTSGNYQFKITNQDCPQPIYISDSIFVGLVDKPVIKAPFPDTLNVCQGSAGGLFTNILNQSVSYTWQKDGANLLNQPYSILSILPFEQQNEGTYRVIMKSFGCADSTISNNSFLKYIERPQTPTLTPSGQLLTVLDSLQIDITPKSQYGYNLQSGFNEIPLDTASSIYLKNSGTFYAIINDSLGCKSDLSTPLQITFDKTKIELINCSVAELDGLYTPISSLPFALAPDINTTIYAKGQFFGPGPSGYYIFRKFGTWRLIRYTEIMVFPGDPPSISSTQYFSAVSNADSVICDMNWIKTSTTLPEPLNFRGACPLLSSYNNSSETTEVACGQYTLPSGTVATASGIYTSILPNSYGADSTITTNLTINQLPVATIFGSKTILPGQSTTVEVLLTGSPPFQIGFDGLTFTSNLNSYILTVAPTVTTTYTLSSVSNDCGDGTISNSIVTVTVIPVCVIPLSPTASNVSRCGSGEVTLSTTNCSGTYNWYTSSTGGNSVASGASYTLPSLSTTSTYYVSCSTGSCESSRASAVAIIKSIPAVPILVANPSTIELGESSTLSATNCAGTVIWSDGLGNGISKTVFPTETKIYKAVCEVNGCVSDSSSVTLTVEESVALSPPVISSPTSSICIGESATLNASGCETGIIEWINMETGVSINISPVINTMYSAVCKEGVDVSLPSNELLITVVPLPATPQLNFMDSTLYQGDSATLTATGCNAGTLIWSNSFFGTSQTLFPTSSETISISCQENGCQSAAVAATITVNERPYIYTQSANLCIESAIFLRVRGISNSTQLQWYKNGIELLGVTDSLYSVSEKGDYSVVVDDNLTLQVRITEPSTSNVILSECSPFVAPNGDSIQVSGNYQFILVNAAGCDSVINLDLTILPSYVSTIDSLVQSSILGLNNEEISESGTFTYAYQTEFGCDSTIIWNVTFSGPAYDTLTFDQQPFSTQTWLENGITWNITDGWGNIRQYSPLRGDGSMITSAGSEAKIISSQPMDVIGLYVQIQGSPDYTNGQNHIIGYDSGGNVLYDSTLNNWGNYGYSFLEVNWKNISQIKFTSPTASDFFNLVNIYIDDVVYTTQPVVDSIPPVIGCPLLVSACGSFTVPDYSQTLTVTDNVSSSGEIAIYQSIPFGTAIIADTTIVIVATDFAANRDTCRVDVRINAPSASSVILSECSPFIAPNGDSIQVSGNYQFILVNAAGCDSVINLDLTILETPSTPILSISDTTIAYGNSLNITASSCNGTVIWNGLDLGNSISFNAVRDTTINVFCINASCESSVNSFNVIVFRKPQIELVSGSLCLDSLVVLKAVNVDVNDKLQWYKDGILLLNQTDSILIAQGSGKYTVSTMKFNDDIVFDQISPVANGGQIVQEMIRDIFFSNEEKGWLVTTTKIYATNNGGLNWSEQYSGGYEEYWSKIQMVNDSVGYVCSGKGRVVKTVDGGLNWSPTSTGTSNFLYSLHFTDADNGWASGRETILKTNNGGLNWINVNSPITATNKSGLGIYFLDSLKGFVGLDVINEMLTTIDGGATWQTSTDISYTSDFKFFNDSLGFALGAGLRKTQNGGSTWENLIYNLYAFDFVSADVGFVVNHANEILKTTDGGLSWNSKMTPTSNQITALRTINSNSGFVGAYTGELFKFSNALESNTVSDTLFLIESFIASPMITNSDTTLCAGTPLTLTATGCSSGVINWSDRQTGSTITVSPAITTTYKVACQQNSCVSDSSAGVVVTVLPKPSIPILNFTDSTIFQGDSVMLMASGCITGDLIWSNGFVGTSQILSPTASVVISVYCQEDGCQSPAAVVAIMISSEIYIYSETTNLCSDTVVVLHARGINPESQLQWYKDGEIITGATDSLFTVVEEGYYSVSNMKTGTESEWQWQNPKYAGNELFDSYFIGTTGWTVGQGGSIAKTVDGGISWKYLDSVGIGDLRAVHFINLQEGWIVGKSNILMKTTDGGGTWNAVATGLPNNYINLHDIAFSDNLNGIIVGSNGILLRTTDGGQTWIQTLNVSTYNLNSIEYINSNLIWIAGDKDKILKSTDGGQTWNNTYQISNPDGWYDLKSVDFVDEFNGWAVGGSTIEFPSFDPMFPPMQQPGLDVILKTTDGGQSWQYSSFNNSNAENLSVNFINNTTGWVSNEQGSVLKTVDGGQSWNVQVSTEGKVYNISTLDLNKVFAFGSNGNIFKTENSGQLWTNYQETVSTANFRDASFTGIDSGWAISGTQIIHTLNGGKNWEVQFTGGIFWNDIQMLNDSIGYTVGSSGTVIKTTNGGVNWNYLNTNSTSYLSAVHFTNDQIGWAVGDQTVLKTNDGGQSWSELTTTLSADYNRAEGVYFMNADTGFIGTSYNYLLKTTDGGNTWTKQYGVTYYVNKFQFLNENVGYLMGNEMMKTIDGGSSWFTVGTYANDFHFVNDSLGFSSSFQGNISKTNDGGINWNIIKTPSSNNLHSIYFFNENNGWVFGDGGQIIKYQNKLMPISQSDSVFINGFIMPPTISNSDTTICIGNSVDLTASNCTNAIYKWNNGQTGSTIIVNPTVTTNYKVSCQQNSCVSDSSTGVVVTVLPSPSIPVLNFTDSTLCQGDSLLLSASGCNTGTLVWSNGFIGNSQTLQPVSSEVILVYCQENSCHSAVVSVTVTVYEKPYIYTESTNLCADSIIVLHARGVSSNTQLQWYKDGVLIAGATDSLYSITVDGNYSVASMKGGISSEWVWQNPNLDNFSISSDLMKDVDFVNENSGWAIGGNRIFHTSNGGDTWQVQFTGEYWNKIQMINDTLGFVASGSGNILKTANGGQSWVYTTTGVSNYLYSLHFSDSQHGWAVGDQGTIIKTSDSGQNWVSVNSPISGTYTAGEGVYFTSPDSGFVGISGYGYMLRTSDGGQNWTTQYNVPAYTGKFQFTSSQIGYLMGNDMRKTTDGGDTWSYVGDYAIDFHFVNDSVGFKSYINGSVQKTVNGGLSWTSINTPSGEHIWAIDFLNENLGWTVGGNGNILKLQPMLTQACLSQPTNISKTISTPIITSTNQTICNGSSLTLTASNCINSAYIWSDGQVGSSITISPTLTSTYKVVCQQSYCVSDSSDAVVIIVNPKPISPTLSANNTTINVGESVTLTTTGCVGGVIQWNNNLGTGSTKTVSPIINTTYSVSCSIAGCLSEITSTSILVDNPNCPENQIFTINNLHLSGILQAIKSINSSITVPNNTTYKAGDAIILLPGFTVENGSIFKAEIEGCGN